MFADYPTTSFVRRWFCATSNGCRGEMLFTGMARTQLTTKFQHQCTMCRRVEWETESYPRIMHKDADERIFS